MSKHITFFNYVVDDVESKEYDPSLPFGGIRQDSPDKIKQEFNDFVKEYNSHIDKLVLVIISSEKATGFIDFGTSIHSLSTTQFTQNAPLLSGALFYVICLILIQLHACLHLLN